MKCFRRNEHGFTLIELLIVVVIIGILAAVGVPIYSRYITNARSSEAPTILMAMKEYVEGYLRAHPTNRWSGPLSVDCNDAPNLTAPTGFTDDGDAGDWVTQVVGDDNEYFAYEWDTDDDAAGNKRIIATANIDLCDTCDGDQMWFSFRSADGDEMGWSASPADSRLWDVLPD